MPDTRNKMYFRDIAKYYDIFSEDWPDEPFFREVAERYDSPVLELGSGTGRITALFAEAGREIVGIDLSREMIEIARAKLQKTPKDVQSRFTLRYGDITNFNLGQRFQLVIIPSSFQFLLTKDDQLGCLKCARAHLKKDGVFILDLWPREAFQEDGTDSITQEIDGKTVTWTATHSNDHSKKICTAKILLEMKHPSGEIERIESSSIIALIKPEEGDLLLDLAGFQIVEEYGGWDYSPYKYDSERRILFLRKK